MKTTIFYSVNLLCSRLGILVLAVALVSCEGILDGIYDSPADPMQDESLPYGFQSIDNDSLGGVLFFNSTSYTRWTYFNLRELQSDTLDFDKDISPETLAEMEPVGWDIALHRSVPKTNGCVAKTSYTSLKALCQACDEVGGVEVLAQRDNLVFEEDEWDDEQVALDLTGMMSGDVLYLPSFYNPVLNSWLDIDITNPPPIYTPSRLAYVLKLRTGDFYGLYLLHFRNSRNITSWLTIEYRRLR